MTSNHRFLRSVFITAAVLALTLAIRVPAHAQQIFGALSGTVTDASGAAVQDVTVTARNTATNLTSPRARGPAVLIPFRTW